MDDILLSVIIPTFRRERLLAGLLDAVIEQSADLSGAVGFEVIVVDNTPEATARSISEARAPVVRFVHEPRRGIAHVRNSGVAAAIGTHVIFIDDDELPEPGWLAGFAAMARAGHRACFGPVLPRYEEPPTPALGPLLDRIFLRDLAAETGQDVSNRRAYLGSGNSMFSREMLAEMDEVFDPRFNAGGEDVLLLRRLVEEADVELIWCAAARVTELVPANRLTPEFIGQRLFKNGQLRCRVEAEAGLLVGRVRVLYWMAAGMIQFVGFLTLSLISLDRDRALRWALRSMSGKGKMLWWRTA